MKIWAEFHLNLMQTISMEAKIGNILSKQNNETILKTISNKHELAAGEFIDILTRSNSH